MHSIQADTTNQSSNEHADWTRQQQFVFTNRQVIKTKQYYCSSVKFHENKTKTPFYQSSRTFQKFRKDDHHGLFDRSSLISFCVPDVYSPGSNGKCSPPPLSSTLPPPPSEWLP